MKRLCSITLAVLALTFSFFIFPKQTVKAEELNEISLTDIISVATDGQNRFIILFNTDYEGSLFPTTRTNSDEISLTMNIDGIDFTFEKGKYIVSFGQNLGAAGQLGLVFKIESGNLNGTNATFYPSNYPGMQKGISHTITFYEDTVIGGFKLAKTATLLIYENNTSGAMVNNPHEVNIQGGTFTKGTYIMDGKTLASENSNVSFTPIITSGMILDSIQVRDANNKIIDILLDQSQNTYTFIMPNYPISIVITEKKVVYTLTLGEINLFLSPGVAIGELPDGIWFVDGLEISSTSIYIWSDNKTATNDANIVYFNINGDIVWKQTYNPIKKGSDILYPSINAKDGYIANWHEVAFDGGIKVLEPIYTLKMFNITFMVDEQIYSTLQFTIDTSSISLPVIPLKSGYRIIGWDLNEFPKQDCIVNAIYEKIS